MTTNDLGDDASGNGSRRRGRPPDTARDKAILAATLEILGERGYSGLTIEGVALSAGVDAAHHLPALAVQAGARCRRAGPVRPDRPARCRYRLVASRFDRNATPSGRVDELARRPAGHGWARRGSRGGPRARRSLTSANTSCRAGPSCGRFSNAGSTGGTSMPTPTSRFSTTSWSGLCSCVQSFGASSSRPRRLRRQPT